MNMSEVFATVKKECSETMALDVVVVLTIVTSTKLKKSDLGGNTQFLDRVEKKARRTLWHLKEEDFHYVLRVAAAYISKIGKK